MRKPLSILLILAYLALQAAAMPHAHTAGEKTHTHAGRHFHTSPLAHHHHGHSHHYRHSHSKPADSKKKPESEPNRPNQPNGPNQHDGDANDIPDVLVERVVSIDLTLADSRLDWTAAVACCQPNLGSVSRALLEHMAAGDVSVEHCALYLSIRHLRI